MKSIIKSLEHIAAYSFAFLGITRSLALGIDDTAIWCVLLAIWMHLMAIEPEAKP